MTKRKLKKTIRRLRHLPKGWNLILYIKNRMHSAILKNIRSTKVAYPSTIMLEVTNHCNLHCTTCPREYDFGKQMDKGYMNFDHLKQIIDEAYPYLDSIGLTGLGETFLYRDLVPAVDYIREKNPGILISVSINAHLRNSAEIVQKLLNKIDTIQISMDGLGDTYNKIRKGGNFDIFQANLTEIVTLTRGTSTEVMLNMVVFEQNYLQMADVLRFAHRIGIRYVNFTPLNMVSITDKALSSYNFYEAPEFKNELEKAHAEASKYKGLEFTCPNFARDKTFSQCKFVWGYFYVSWDGYLPPCCAKPFPKELNFGNVFENGLLTTLNSPAYRQFRQMWLDKDIPEFCSNCF